MRVTASVIVCLLGCILWVNWGFGAEDQLDYSAEQSVLNSCAANSMFLICRLCDSSATYDKCLKVLPRKAEGNSMLALKQALEGEGIIVEADRLDTSELWRIAEPAILLWPASDNDVGRRNRLPGHFIVIRPLSRSRIQVLDYGYAAPFILSTSETEQRLIASGISELPVLLCRKSGNSAPMLLPQDEVKNGEIADSVAVKTTSPTVSSNSEVTLSPGSKSQVVGWDFGEVEEGSAVSHVFSLKNMTGRALHIEKLQTSCGCTKIASSTNVISIGDTCTISMEVSLAGRTMGRQSLFGVAQFAPNDGLPPLVFQITGSILQRWIAEPGVIDFGKVRNDAGLEHRQIVLMPASGHPIQHIERVQTNTPGVTASILGPDPRNSDWMAVQVELDPANATGFIDQPLEIFVQGRDRVLPVAEIIGDVSRVIDLRPERLVCQTDSSGSVSASAVLSNPEGKKVRVVDFKMQGLGKHMFNVTSTVRDDGSSRVAIKLLAWDHKWHDGNLQLIAVVDGVERQKIVDLPFIVLPDNP